MNQGYHAFARLQSFDPESGDLNVIIETPKESRNKLVFDDRTGLFRLKKVLPAGSVFPFDFGFVRGTRGEDGDPLDILVLLDEPVYPGCWVPARLVGVIEAEQTETEAARGEGPGAEQEMTRRNDRLIAIAAASQAHRDVQSLEDLSPRLLDEIEHFFTSYNELEGRAFRLLGRFGPDKARELITASSIDSPSR